MKRKIFLLGALALCLTGCGQKKQVKTPTSSEQKAIKAKAEQLQKDNKSILQKAEENQVKQSTEAKKILERLASSGDDYSMVDLSLYYPETDKMVRTLNLQAAAKLNTTAFYNLGVYYYNKKNKQKSKFYFKVAKENGYDIGEIFDAYLGN